MAFDLQTGVSAFSNLLGNSAGSTSSFQDKLKFLEDGNLIDETNKRFLCQIRDQHYYVEIWLYNQIDGQEKFGVPYVLIDTLCIEETLMDWAVKGYFITNDKFELFQKNKEDGKTPFIFRSDGRNRISINILPIVADTSTVNLFTGKVDTTSEEFKSKWQMSFDCVIYDVEDLDTDSNQVKRRKFYFWDERYQLFSEKNIEWSTAYDGIKEMGGTPTIGATDRNRAIPANTAIKSIIKKASINPNGDIIKVGFSEGASIDNPNKRLDSISMGLDWLEGSNENNVLYTSPANSTVIDDLSYMIPFAGTSDDGPVFLSIDRTQKNKMWNLISLKEYFKRSKKEQVERIFVGFIDSAEKMKPYVPRAFSEDGNQIFNFMSGIGTSIQSYQFSPMVSSDDKRITNSPIHSYDFSSGTFTIKNSKNTASEVLNSMEEISKAGLYNFTESTLRNQAHVLLNLNQTKKQGISLENKFIPNKFYPECFTRNQMIKDALFLNESLSFYVPGLTIRAPGRFIFIDNPYTADEDSFNDRFFGQWMIIKVVHIFKQDSYMSRVVANKIDSYSKIWEKEDTNF